jgi:serine/threonine protein kinase
LIEPVVKVKSYRVRLNHVGNAIDVVLPEDILMSQLSSIYEEKANVSVGEECRVTLISKGRSNEVDSEMQIANVAEGDDQVIELHLTGTSAKTRSEEDTFNMDDYEVVVQLGAGTFGQVWGCKHKIKGHEIAVKSIDVRDFDRSKREVLLLQRCHHPCVLGFIGVAWSAPPNNQMKIATPLIRPGSLGSLIAQRKLTPTDKSNVSIGIAMGMRYLYDRNVLHRDLKPDNVLIDHDMHTYNCDFGQAKVNEDGKPQSMAGGTPRYQSPEVINGEGEYSFPADVFSYGSMFYEILTGEKAFPGEAPYHVQSAICSGQKNPKAPACLHKDLVELFDGFFKIDPEARPTFEQICAAFESVGYEIVKGSDVPAINQYVAVLKNAEIEMKL